MKGNFLRSLCPRTRQRRGGSRWGGIGGGIRLFSGDVRRHRKSINGRGGSRRNVDVVRRYTLLAREADDHGRARGSVPFRTIAKYCFEEYSRTRMSCALIASRSAGPEYDCFIIRSSSRTWENFRSALFFSLSLSLSLFLFFFSSCLFFSVAPVSPRFRVSYIIVLLPSNYVHRRTTSIVSLRTPRLSPCS